MKQITKRLKTKDDDYIHGNASIPELPSDVWTLIIVLLYPCTNFPRHHISFILSIMKTCKLFRRIVYEHCDNLVRRDRWHNIIERYTYDKYASEFEYDKEGDAIQLIRENVQLRRDKLNWDENMARLAERKDETIRISRSDIKKFDLFKQNTSESFRIDCAIYYNGKPFLPLLFTICYFDRDYFMALKILLGQ